MVTRRLAGAFAATLGAFATSVLTAHEVPVHQELTKLSVDYLLAQRPELAACGHAIVREPLREGVTREDDYTRFPIGTFFYHFEPALHDDVNSSVRVDASCSSIQWATQPGLCLASGSLAVFPRYAIDSNSVLVYPNVVRDLAAVPGTQAKSRGLIGLGHLIHLMQDLASPAHTQNDAHPHIPFRSELLGDPSIYEATNITRASFPLPLPTGPLIPFSSIDAAMSDLQRYTSANFPSEKTLLAGGAPAHDRVDADGYLWRGAWRVARIDPDTHQIVIDVPVASDQFDQLAVKAIHYSASLINFVHERAPVCEQGVQVTVSGAGVVTSTADGVRPAGEDRLSCDSGQLLGCNHSFPSGTTVRLTPQPTPGRTFVRWTGACSAAGTGPCTLTMDGVTALVVGAEFTPESFTGTWRGSYTFGPMLAVLQQTGPVVSGQITDAAGCVWTVDGFASGSQLSLPSWTLRTNPTPPTICVGGRVTMSGTLASSQAMITGTGTTILASGSTHQWTFTLTLTGRTLRDAPL